MQAAKSCSSTHQKATLNLKPTTKKQRKLFKDKGKNIKRSTPYSIKAHHSIKTSHNIKRSHRALQSQITISLWTYSFYSYVIIKNTRVYF